MKSSKIHPTLQTEPSQQTLYSTKKREEGEERISILEKTRLGRFSARCFDDPVLEYQFCKWYYGNYTRIIFCYAFVIIFVALQLLTEAIRGWDHILFFIVGMGVVGIITLVLIIIGRKHVLFVEAVVNWSELCLFICVVLSESVTALLANQVYRPWNSFSVYVTFHLFLRTRQQSQNEVFTLLTLFVVLSVSWVSL